MLRRENKPPHCMYIVCSLSVFPLWYLCMWSGNLLGTNGTTLCLVRNSSQTAKIRGQNAEERVEAWHTHFKNLLGSPPEVDGGGWAHTPYLPRHTYNLTVVLDYINKAYETRELPEQWSTLNIVPVLNRLRPVLDPLLRHWFSTEAHNSWADSGTERVSETKVCQQSSPSSIFARRSTRTLHQES